MFDEALGSTTAANGSIAVTIAGGAVNAIALLDVTGSTVRVQSGSFDQSKAVVNGGATFLDLADASGAVTVTITGSGQVKVGTLLLGRLATLGITEASPTAGITDFSKKLVDDFGGVTIVQRAWAKRMTAKGLIATGALDLVANRLAGVRARPCLWVGQSGIESLTIYGFVKEWSIEVGETVSKLSLSIEGLSVAPAIIEGVTNDQLIAQVADARARATAAQAEINIISSDLYLSASEKPQTYREVAEIYSERPNIIAQADALQVSRTAYLGAFQALEAYLLALVPAWSDTTTDTPINPTIFNAKFSDYYAERIAVLMAIADKSANNTAIGDKNRVRYSLMEAGTAGWGLLYNPSGLNISQAVPEAPPYKLAQVSGAFTAAGQQFSVGNAFLADKTSIIRVAPGERVAVQLKTQVDVPDSGGSWDYSAGWVDANGNRVGGAEPLFLGGGVGDSFGVQLQQFATVPPGCFGIWLEGYVHSNGPGVASIGLFEPMVCSAGPLQTRFPPFSAGDSNQLGADVTTVLVGPASVNVPYDYTGTVIQEIPVLNFYQSSSTGAQTTGIVTAYYSILEGGFNGVAAGVGPQAISVVNGVALFGVSSLDSESCTVRLTVTRNGVSRQANLIINKMRAPPPAPAGGGAGGSAGGTMGSAPASQASGFSALASSAMVPVSSVLTYTMPTGVTTTRLASSLTFRPAKTGGAGAWTIEIGWQVNIGTSASPNWALVGNFTQSAGSAVYSESEPGTPGITYADPADFYYNPDATGLTAGGTYEWRVVARIASGSLRSHVVTGSVSVSS